MIGMAVAHLLRGSDKEGMAPSHSYPESYPYWVILVPIAFLFGITYDCASFSKLFGCGLKCPCHVS